MVFKKNKTHSVILLFQIRNEALFFYYPDILQTAFKASVHSKKLGIAKVICKLCPQFISENGKKLFQIVFNEMIKDKRITHMERMVRLLSILGHQPSYLSKHLIWRVFNHKSSQLLCNHLQDYNILNSIVSNINVLFDEHERQELISAMIFYNNYVPLEKLVSNFDNDLSVNDLVWASLVSCDNTVVVCLDGFKQKRFNQRLKRCITHICLNRKNDEISRRVRHW